jgi:CHAT domain-containing protein/tetratricopeptide (TPR) repeat protein
MGRALALSAAVAVIAVEACTARERSPTPDTAKRGSGVASGSEQLLAAGDSVYFAGAYDSARATHERAIATARGDSTVVARALTSLGLVAWKQGRFDDAKAIGEQALALKQRIGLKSELARSFNALGLLANDRGELDEAVRRLSQARTAAEAVNDSFAAAKARGNLGLALQNMGDFDRARIEFGALRDGAVAAHERRFEANALNNLGMLETRVGNPLAAIERLTSARAIYASLDYVVGIENALGQLGVAYAELGETSRALAYLDSALTVATKAGLTEPAADDLEIIGDLYESVGDHRRALDFFHRARAPSESLGMQQKLGHVALGEARAYAALGNLTLARTRAREAIDWQTKAGARPELLEAQLYLAELAQRGGDADGAQSSLALARVTAKRIDRGTTVVRIALVLGAARVADIAGRPTDVLDALATVGGDSLITTPEEHAEIEALRARAHARMGRFDRAAEAGRRAVAAVEHIRSNMNSGVLRTSYTAERIQTYSDLVVALLKLGRTDDAFQVADASRGRGLADRLGFVAHGLGGGRAAGDVAVADSLLRRIDVLVRQLRTSDSLRGPQPSRAADVATGNLANELSRARRVYESMLDRVSNSLSGSAILGLRATTVAEVRGALTADEALVEFFSTADRLTAFVVSRDRVQWLVVPIGSAALAEHVRLARELIASKSPASSAPLRELYSKLVAPLERERMLAGVRSLVIVPHGALASLPFAALESPSDSGTSRFLVSRYSILVVGSAGALPSLRGRTITKTPADAAVLAPLPQTLPSTRQEVAAVGAEVHRARISLGADANEGRAREALAQSPFVHIASHATLDAESPMFSSVELAAGPNRSKRDDDGRLETHEVLSLEIHSRLVFLSGCETALGGSWFGQYSRHDDYATLAQAFLFAGASNVVATLWRIDDRAAAAFAKRFYAELASTSPANALARAQRALMQDPVYASPYYWAAYTVSGSDRVE